jgi:hypothetical protein
MPTKLQVCIDCADPATLAEFWAYALHYELESPPDGSEDWLTYWRSIGVPEEELGDADGRPESVVDPGGTGPRIFFQQVPETKTIKNRLHLDLGVSGGRTVPLDTRGERVDAEVQRLVASGARILHVNSTPGLDHYGVTLADPEGNEFCVH